MTVTEELDALIAQYDGSARDALNHTLAKLQAANAEIMALKGIHPASEPPDDQRDIILIVDGEEMRGWHGKVTGYYYQSADLESPADDTIVTPTAWKELPND